MVAMAAASSVTIKRKGLNMTMLTKEMIARREQQIREATRAHYSRLAMLPPSDCPIVRDEMQKIRRESQVQQLAVLAREALDVQDACNLSGVVHSFSDALRALRMALPNAGTKEINNHPIVRVWMDKLTSMCGGEMHGMTHDYMTVHDMAERR